MACIIELGSCIY